MTQEKIAELIQGNKANFVDIMKESLRSVLGDNSAQSSIFHLGDEEALRDPDILAEKLASFFHDGSETILEEILKKLEASKTK